MAESYPYHQPAATPAGTDPADLQRLLARVKQDEMQLAADQRQLKLQRVTLDKLQAECDARRLELEAAVQSLHRDRQHFEEQKHVTADGLDAQRTALFRRQEDLDCRAAELKELEANLQTLTRQLDSRQRDLQDRERQLQARADYLEGRQREIDAARNDLAAIRKTLDDRQASLDKRQFAVDRLDADLRAQASSLQQLQAQRQQEEQDLTGVREQIQRQQAEMLEQLQRRQKELDQQYADLAQAQQEVIRQQTALREQNAVLQAHQDDLRARQAGCQDREADLRRQSEQLQARADRLADQQRQLEQLGEELQRQRQLPPPSAPAPAEEAESLQQRDAQLAAAKEQIAAISRRLEGLQAELVRERKQKQKAVAELDDLAGQYDVLQSRLDAWMAAAKDPVAVISSQPVSPLPTDEMAALAAQAVQVRRRSAVAGRLPSPRQGRRNLLAAASAAVLAGLLVAALLYVMLPARYQLQARLDFAPQSPLASAPVMARIDEELTGRLHKARLPGTLLVENMPAVLVDAGAQRIHVRMLTVAPEQAQEALRGLLAQYSVQLEGSVQDAARSRQDRLLADQAAAAEAQLQQWASARKSLQTQLEQAAPQAKAYDDSRLSAQEAREQLDELNRKSSDVKARLRVLRRTPPGARVDLSPERIATATAADVQLAEVRGQVATRAAELRNLLAGLLGSAAGKCDQMDSQLDGFGNFLAGQQEQMADEVLRGQTTEIAQQAGTLKDVLQRSRRQIEDLAGVLARSQDVAQAASLVAVQAQSEKTLESLTTEAAEAIRQIDGLLEKIPAGGLDVTRRTVLQQRLRAQFAQVQKTQQELSDTLNGLRPAVNFRLDAALTAVSGLARRLDDRQKALAEQIQHQDAQTRRQDYDRQVQQAQSEIEESDLQADRLVQRLTEATGQMLQADADRSRLIQLRAQLDDLDRRISETRTTLETVRRKQADLQAAASQPAVKPLADPEILRPAVNHAMRLGWAALAGVIVASLILGGYLRMAQNPGRKAFVTSPSDLVSSTN